MSNAMGMPLAMLRACCEHRVSNAQVMPRREETRREEYKSVYYPYRGIESARDSRAAGTR